MRSGSALEIEERVSPTMDQLKSRIVPRRTDPTKPDPNPTRNRRNTSESDLF